MGSDCYMNYYMKPLLIWMRANSSAGFAVTAMARPLSIGEGRTLLGWVGQAI